jgi:hypothetical protein
MSIVYGDYWLQRDSMDDNTVVVTDDDDADSFEHEHGWSGSAAALRRVATRNRSFFASSRQLVKAASKTEKLPDWTGSPSTATDIATTRVPTRSRSFANLVGSALRRRWTKSDVRRAATTSIPTPKDSSSPLFHSSTTTLGSPESGETDSWTTSTTTPAVILPRVSSYRHGFEAEESSEEEGDEHSMVSKDDQSRVSELDERPRRSRWPTEEINFRGNHTRASFRFLCSEDSDCQSF